MNQFFTSSPSETKFGYCRALEVDGWIFVSGTMGSDWDKGGTMAEDVESQARQMVKNVGKILADAGSCLEDVVMRSIFLKDAKDTASVWEIVNEKMSHSPANQGLEVKFLRPDIKVYMSVIARKGAGAKLAAAKREEVASA
jgi:enamine deaminase RidA (YjgF/YER057c/UK114 family)